MPEYHYCHSYCTDNNSGYYVAVIFSVKQKLPLSFFCNSKLLCFAYFSERYAVRFAIEIAFPSVCQSVSPSVCNALNCE